MIRRSNQKIKRYLLIAAVIVLGIAVACYLYKFTAPIPDPKTEQKSPLETVFVTGSQWDTVESRLCDIKFTLPPRIAPYSEVVSDPASPFNGHEIYWQVYEHSYPAGWFNLDPTQKNEHHVYITRTKNHLSDSGAVTAGIYVQCAQNINNLSQAKFVDVFAKQIHDMGLAVTDISKVQKWGHQIKVFTVNGESGVDTFSQEKMYVLATETNLYFFIQGNYNEQFPQNVQNDVNTIFDSIRIK